MRDFVVLDRDGTVIEEQPYLSDPARVRLLPNAAAGLRALSDAGMELTLVTNQSGVGRGFFGLDAVSRVNERMLALLAKEGVTIDHIFVCPHSPVERCACRKPGTLMLDLAAQRLGAPPTAGFVVGDKACDVEMGRRAGARSLLVRTGWGRHTESETDARPNDIVDDLLDAARVIHAASAATSRYSPGSGTSAARPVLAGRRS